MRPQKIGLNALICIILIALSSFASNVSIGTFGVLTWIAPLLVIHVIFMSVVHKQVNRINYTDILLYVLYAIIFYICTIFNGDGNIGRNSLMIQYLICVMIFICTYIHNIFIGISICVVLIGICSYQISITPSERNAIWHLVKSKINRGNS